MYTALDSLLPQCNAAHAKILLKRIRADGKLSCAKLGILGKLAA